MYRDPLAGPIRNNNTAETVKKRNRETRREAALQRFINIDRQTDTDV